MKCNVLEDFKKAGPYRCNYIIENASIVDAAEDDGPVDADSLDDYYKELSGEAFHKAHINAALKTPEDRDVSESRTWLYRNL